MPTVSRDGPGLLVSSALYERWTDEEKAVVAAAASCTDAQRLYRDAFPLSRRGPRAAEGMWYRLRGTT